MASVVVDVNVVDTFGPEEDGTAVNVVVVCAFNTLKFSETPLLAYRYGGAVNIWFTLTECAPTVRLPSVIVAVSVVVVVLVEPNGIGGCWLPSTVKMKLPVGMPTLLFRVVVAVTVSVWP